MPDKYRYSASKLKNLRSAPGINNVMEPNNQTIKSLDNKEQLDKTTSKTTSKTPDESSGVLIQSHVKIFDPETDEVFFAGRA